MLDYAANGVMYWPLDRLRSTFEANCKDRGRDPEATLLESLNLGIDTEEFWQKAITNLQAGKVRLIFVADKIPAELRRIVEFLNEQMNPAEVLAVEIKQHVAEDLIAFVPRLIGQTTQAQRTKSVGVRTSRIWNETRFFEELQAQSPEAVKPARAIFEWAESHVSQIVWGKGKQFGTFYPTLDHGHTVYKPIHVWTDGLLYIQFADIITKPPFSEEDKRRDFLRRLNKISDISIPEEAIDKYPAISLSTLNNESALDQFLRTLDWFVEEVKAT